MAKHTSAYPTPLAFRSLADILGARPETVIDAVRAPSHQRTLAGADVVEVAELLGIDFATAPFTVEDLLLGLEMERDLEYECAPSMVGAPDEDLVELGTIAVAHLQEQPDYYARLTQAQAPGDPPVPAHARHDVGAD